MKSSEVNRMTEKQFEKWGHYEVIDTHKDLDDEDMTEKRFEFREVNCTGIVPKAYDNEKQQYANLFECVNWLNDLHKENEELKKILGFLKNDNATDILNVLNCQENRIWKLKEENEQLNSEIQKLKNVSTK